MPIASISLSVASLFLIAFGVYITSLYPLYALIAFSLGTLLSVLAVVFGAIGIKRRRGLRRLAVTGLALGASLLLIIAAALVVSYLISKGSISADVIGESLF